MRTSDPTLYFGVDATLGVEYFLGKNFSVYVLTGLAATWYSDKAVAKYKTDADMTQEELDLLNYNKKIAKASIISTDLLIGNVGFSFYF